MKTLIIVTGQLDMEISDSVKESIKDSGYIVLYHLSNNMKETITIISPSKDGVDVTKILE